MLYNVLQEKRELILKMAVEHGIQNVQIFSSVAKLKDDSTSDVDLLVDFEEGKSLFDLIRFKEELENILDVKVDIVTEDALHWSIKENVLNEAIQL